jgi:hypothetical protein
MAFNCVIGDEWPFGRSFKITPRGWHLAMRASSTGVRSSSSGIALAQGHINTILGRESRDSKIKKIIMASRTNIPSISVPSTAIQGIEHGGFQV